MIAWSDELRAVHARIRQALDPTRRAIADGEPAQQAGRDLLLFCKGSAPRSEATTRPRTASCSQPSQRLIPT